MSLLGSAPSLDGIKDVITQFYCGANVTLTPEADGTWRVATGRGDQAGVVVRVRKGRYRFEHRTEAP